MPLTIVGAVSAIGTLISGTFFVKEAGVQVRANYGIINGPGHFRVSTCAPWSRLAIGLERIQNALESLSNS